jgi:hypothetical protein
MEIKYTNMDQTRALKIMVVISGVVLFFCGGLICLRGIDGYSRGIGMMLSGTGSIMFLIGAVI